MSDLSIEVEAAATPREVRLAGEIDLSSVDALKQALEQLVDVSSDVVVDLSRVTFIDSSGISALVVASLALQPARLVVRGASDFIRHSFDVAGVAYLCD